MIGGELFVRQQVCRGRCSDYCCLAFNLWFRVASVVGEANTIPACINRTAAYKTCKVICLLYLTLLKF